MSKPRYKWWSYIKAVIRDYPQLCKEQAVLHSQSVTANYSGMQGGTEPSRGTEVIAVRELPGTAQREYEAVRRAIAITERYRNGQDRLNVVRLVLWDRSHTLEGAALCVPVSYDTAQNWQCDFIHLVAKNYGLKD